MGSNINSNIIGLPPIPSQGGQLTVFPNKIYTYPTNPLGIGVWRNTQTGVSSVGNTGQNLNASLNMLVPGANALETFGNIGEKVQDRSFWYTAIALIVGVILAIVALNGLVMQESSKIMKAGLK